MRVAISSGHALHVQGAVGILNELTENRRVTPIIANHLRAAGVNVVTFDDNTSRTVAQNLDTINSWHNRQTRDLDVQVHFNAFAPTQAARGTEVCHRNQAALATRVSAAMARAGGFIDRGQKPRTNLSFLNRMARPAILLEVCFVDSAADVRLYQANIDPICRAIADSIRGASTGGGSTTPPATPPAAGSRPTIRNGSRGDAVREAQQLLNRHGAGLNMDGVFGNLTEAAVRRFQGERSLAADGIVGPITWGRLIG
jgi:N-acetylmuramoyl-L-alanine amidase-like protein/putative peptidoglycan binding protein